MVHIGAHGTLEWLPGKAVALSGTCWPEVLAGQMAVIYPFIVNDPGEAAQAKRRISAVTIGHLPPPLVTAGTQEKFSRLEALLDEFSNADGLDPKRRDRLMKDIQDEAEQIGLAQDLGLDEACNEADSLQRIDQFVCDVKDSQFTSGLHIFGAAQLSTLRILMGMKMPMPNDMAWHAPLPVNLFRQVLPAHPIGDGQIFYLPAGIFLRLTRYLCRPNQPMRRV